MYSRVRNGVLYRERLLFVRYDQFDDFRCRQQSICRRPRFPRKFEFWWIGSFASLCPACWWPLQGGWPRWASRRKLQPLGTVSFCRWNSRDVLRLGSIDRPIFFLSCKRRTLGWPLRARLCSMTYTRGKRLLITLPGRQAPQITFISWARGSNSFRRKPTRFSSMSRVFSGGCRREARSEVEHFGLLSVWSRTRSEASTTAAKRPNHFYN